MRLLGTPRLYLRERLGPFRFIIPLLTKSRAPYYTHPGCPMHHRRTDTAAKCAGGSRGPIIRHH
jgi:hypothetical protein